MRVGDRIESYVLITALQNKDRTEINLAKLDDSLADRARVAMLKRLEVN
jgi:lipid II isoglutaminyl synthase (glutamine-hydrolysing)